VNAIRWFGPWWRQADHYYELSSILKARGLATFARLTISAVAAGLAADALATIWTPTGPRTAVQLTCTLAAGAGAAIGSLVWALRWPTRATAVRFTLMASISIALIALGQSDPAIAMGTCTAFATLACYLALFHTPPLLVYNIAIASVICAEEAVRMAVKYNILTGICAFALMLLLNLGVPLGVQVVVHLLGADAVLAERDQLTGLLTRRAFRRQAKACLQQASEELAHVVIAVIDLDRFKQLNDNYGHRTGDDALVAVARALRDTADDTAVIGRSGGEEFVIADLWHPGDVSGKARQLCDVIAALPFDTTASIGTVGIHPAHGVGDSDHLLVELIAAADAAMYVAKRRGGNQVSHHEWPLPTPLDIVTDDETGYRSGGISA
jgi:diguanylate cyclase (GGDEF)-like protein